MPFSHEKFQNFLRNFLSDEYEKKEEEIDFHGEKITKVKLLGVDSGLDNLKVYEIIHKSEHDPRVTLSRETFKMMNRQGTSQALAVFVSEDKENNPNYRFSYLTIDIELDKSGKLTQKYSNPRRYSFFLGPNAKTHTPEKFLIKKGKVKSIDDLKERFSIEVVNKEFYSQIADLFKQLVKNIKLLSVSDEKTKQEFVVRLIGRVIFSWFLKNKKSKSGKPLIPEEVLSLSAVKKTKNYYHEVLEPLFFEILNTEKDKRHSKFRNDLLDDIPFLNGGLFDPKGEDFYEFDKATGYSKCINTLNIPNDWMEKFFEVLESYNFTIDENTPVDIELSVDPEMLGRIFENLLAEINPETQKSARKATGSYYTPREIVEYMVDESLKYFLVEKTSIEESKIKNLLSYSSENEELSEEEKNKIIDALNNLRVLDPACGSGAFPMGILQKISLILHKIDPNAEKWKEKQLANVDPTMRKIIEDKLKDENEEFIRKLGIVEKTIHGVDVQEIAVEIAKLRVFLSLIVDSEVNDLKENRGIKALPNLEFKFVCANTLNGLPDKIRLFEDEELIKRLKKLREEYFTSYGERKGEIEKEFKRIQNEMAEKHHFSPDNVGTRTMFLSIWDPFGTESSSWFDPEWMFGIKDGFDIVIANPPYIQLQKAVNATQKYADLYKNEGYKTFERTGDIYCLFYEKGIQLLKDDGILCYITSNKWMRAKYGEKLRVFLSRYNPLAVIDLGPGVFDSATNDTNILIVQKTDNQNKLKGITITKKDLSKFEDDDFISLPNFRGSTWFIGTNSERKLKEKIENIGKPLKDWDVKIYYGIKTGLNEAFIISSEKRQEILDNCKDDEERKRTEEIIKPILRGRDIKRYAYKWAGLWVILAKFDSYKYLPTKYPAVYDHLLKYKDKLKNRGQCRYSRNSTSQNKLVDYPGQHHWLELDNNPKDDYLKNFEKEKVVWKEMSEKPAFSYDNNSMFCNDTARIMTGKNIKFLVAFFNSLFFQNMFSEFYAGGNLGKKGIRFKHTFMEQFPIPPITDENKHIVSQIESFVDQTLLLKKQDPDTDTIKYEREIDQLVYELYELTPEEIEIVEKSLK